MGSRNYICSGCGLLVRHLDLGRGIESPRQHCGGNLQPLSHEQTFVASHLDDASRLKWFWRGAYILKGPTKRKKWLPAFTDDEIAESKGQEINHVRKKARKTDTLRFIADPNYAEKIVVEKMKIDKKDRENGLDDFR